MIEDGAGRIVGVELQRVEDAPLPRPLALAWDPGTIRTHDSFTIVRVHTTGGAVGVGTVGKAKPVRLAAAALVGADVRHVAANAQVLHDAGGAYGLDMALWDVVGQLAGEPLWRLWGAHADRVPAYASTVEVGDTARRVDDALGFAAEGFRGLKLRLHHEELAHDVALAEAVRDAVGDRLVLMADANQARAAEKGTAVQWSYERARDTARALRDLGFGWLEEPLPADDLDGLARLRAEVGLPIAGGERDQGLDRLVTLAASDAYDVVQPDGVTGEGIGRLVEVAAVAARRGARCIPHHGGGGVGAWAHLHLAAGLPNAGWFEVIRDRPGEMPWPAQFVPLPTVAIDDVGEVVAPPGAGLGITLDEDYLDRYTVTRTMIDGSG